jgi:hypothetical protein
MPEEPAITLICSFANQSLEFRRLFREAQELCQRHRHEGYDGCRAGLRRMRLSENLAGVITPIPSGYILTMTGSHDGVLAFVAAHAVQEILAHPFSNESNPQP